MEKNILDENSYSAKMARLAFPILIRQAKARKTIFYSDLVKEIGMSNPRNLNKVLVYIGNAIKSLEKSSGEHIPLINSLVVNKRFKIPSSGISVFYSNYDEMTKSQKKDIFEEQFKDAFSYSHWDDVLNSLGLQCNGVISDVASCFKIFKDVQKALDMSEESGYVPGKFIFRGLEDVTFNVISSAGRRLKNLNKQNDFIRYHVNLVTNARKLGYGNIDLKTELTDLQILAKMQHLGGATCLIDFTTNFLIALWFATSPKHKADGKILWLDLGQPSNFRLINYCNGEDEEKRIQQILKGLDFSSETKNQNKAEPCYWLWTPPQLNDRIFRQSSVFLFGLRAFPKISGITNNLKFGTVIIPKDKKECIRKELEQFFGISAETVFHDFSGYSLNANESGIPVSESILSTRDCLVAAKENIKKREYSLAVNYLDEAIECLRCNGECKRGIRTKGICCYSYREIAFWRGRANEGRGYTDEAILNYNEAIADLSTMNDDNHRSIYDAYRQKIYLYYDKNDFKSALTVAEKLWKLYLEHTEWDNNGHDVIFYLLELSILTGCEKKFVKYSKDGESLSEKFKYTNGDFLWIYFSSIGESIFHKRIESLKNKSNDIENTIVRILDDSKNEKINLIGSYYWNFEDIIKWFNSSDKKIKKEYADLIDSNRDELSLFTKKADEAQNRLVSHVFAKSVAFVE